MSCTLTSTTLTIHTHVPPPQPLALLSVSTFLALHPPLSTLKEKVYVKGRIRKSSGVCKGENEEGDYGVVEVEDLGGWEEGRGEGGCTKEGEEVRKGAREASGNEGGVVGPMMEIYPISVIIMIYVLHYSDWKQ